MGTGNTDVTGGGGKGNTATPPGAPEPYVAVNPSADNGKGTKTVGNITSSPWGPLQQPVLDFVKDAMGQFDATGGVGGNISPLTTQGINSIANTANAGVPNLGAANTAIGSIVDGLPMQNGIAQQVQKGLRTIGTGDEYQSLFNNANGATETQKYGQGIAQNGAGVSNNVANNLAQNGAGVGTGVSTNIAQNGMGNTSVSTEGQLQQLLGQTGSGGAAADYLTKTARGDYLNSGDPYLETLIADSTRKTADALKDSYSAAGRYGGATMNRDLVDRVFAGEAGARSANYQNERGRQLEAATALEAAQQGRSGISRGLLSDITGNRQQDVSNRFTNAGLRLGAEDQRNSTLFNNANLRQGAEAQGNSTLLANSGLKLDAAGQMDAARNNAAATALAALGGKTGVEAANIGNMLGAENQINQNTLANATQQQNAAGLLPMLTALGFAPGQALMEAGGAQQDLPYSNINQIAPLLFGAAGMGGNQTETAPKTPFKDFLSTLFGGLGAIGSFVK